MNIKDPFALMIRYNSKPADLKFQPKNIVAYLATSSRAASLEHNHFRWVRKSNVSIADKMITIPLHFSKRVKIISNGINSIVEKLE